MIDQPGSYYLTQNLTGASGANGIEISAENVLLDLNGFTLLGVAGSLDGISTGQTTQANLRIRNGSVRGWGGDGIDAWDAGGCHIEDVTAIGCGGDGLRLGQESVVLQCVSRVNGGDGITARARSDIRDSAVFGNGGSGISLQSESVCEGCTVRENTGTGIRVNGARVRVEGNTSSGNGTGIHATLISGGTHIVGNSVVGNTVGLSLQGSGKSVADNWVLDNDDNYSFGQGNHLSLLLCEIPESIDWPATVTLAGSLTGASGQSGLEITASDVTVDLAGHSLIGVEGSLHGILVPAEVSGLRLRNGTLRDWGQSGLEARDAISSHFDRLHARDNGVSGLVLGQGNVLTNSTAQGNLGGALLQSAIICLEGCRVESCTARDNRSHGFAISSGGALSGCVAIANDRNGFLLYECTIVDSAAQGNGENGIRLEVGCTAIGNTCEGNGTLVTTGAGIEVGSLGNRVENNTATGNDRGIEALGAGNVIVRNVATNNGSLSSHNYAIVAGNSVGPILAPSDPITSTNPWANFR